MDDISENLISSIKDAYKSKNTLKIVAGNSKHFYGRNIDAEELNVAKHSGILDYEPTELYITARSGTLLSDIENEIEKYNQTLPFEAPHFGSNATLGGAVAVGLSGPRRLCNGSIKDCILGIEIINGKGEDLHFGGTVMKNVAGYDVSRLMCGSLGTLGLILSVTIKLMPKPQNEQTLSFEIPKEAAITKLNDWANFPFPITASFYDGSRLFIRLSGAQVALEKCHHELGGDLLSNNEKFWNSVKEHTHDFFLNRGPLWRISIPPNACDINLNGKSAIEWNGALRWIFTDEDNIKVQETVNKIHGYATLFRGHQSDNVFHPLSRPLMRIHKKLKNTFDPANILNPGKMYAEI